MILCYSCMNEVDKQETVCPHCHHAIPYYPTDPRDLKPGTLLHGGRFIIGRALGHGGFGITYIAFDKRLKAIRTIKEYYPKYCERGADNCPIVPPEKEESVRRNRENFLHEARMMSQASNAHIEHIVSVFDQFDENNTSYILMEYLDGKTIDDYMRDVINRPFKWKEAVPLAVEILTALGELHKHNIIHRDISCNNIFLLPNKGTCLIDFGSAELLDIAQNHPEQVKPSKKPAYTPLEQINQQKQGTYSDIYAMAVVIFKMIAGNADQKLNGQMLPSLRERVNDPTIPLELDKILMEATNPDPEKRIQSAAEMGQRLQKLVGGKKKKATPIQLALGALGAVIVLFIGIIALLPQGSGGSFAVPTLGYVATENVKNNTMVLADDGVVEVSGTAQADAELVMTVSALSGTEALIRETITADGSGRWTWAFRSADLETPANTTRRYKVSVAYTNASEPPAENDLVLEVNRQFAELTLRYDGTTSTSKTVTLGDKVQLEGSAEQGQRVVIEVMSGAETILQMDKLAADGSWTAELDTAAWNVKAGQTENYQIAVSYELVDVRSGSLLQLMVKAPQDQLTLGFEGTDEEQMIATSMEEQIVFAGSATPGASIVLQVGDKTYYPSAADQNGRWYYALPVVQLGVQAGEETEYKVTASYPNDGDGRADRELTLLVHIQQEAGRVTPTLGIVGTENVSARMEGADSTLQIHGTAAAGASLGILADGERLMDVTADVDGNWQATLTMNDFNCARGTSHTYKVEAVDAEDDTNRSLQTLRVYVNNPIVYQKPTLAFEDGSLTKSATVGEKVIVGGVGEPGQRMTLSMENANETVTVSEDGSWSYELDLSDYGVNPGESISLSLNLRYVDQPDVAADDTLSLTVENPLLDAPTLRFYSESGQTLVVGEDSMVTVTGEAVAGQTLELYAVGLQWSVQTTAAADGRWNCTVDVGQLAKGNSITEIRLNVRYTAQTVVTAAEPLKLSIDRFAEPIMLKEGQIDDDMTAISGTAEPGATIECRMNGTVLGSVIVSNDGSFTLSGLNLTGGNSLQFLETDIYGNSMEINVAVTIRPRDPILPDGVSKGQTIVYGPQNAAVTLTGTAQAGKRLSASVSGGMSASYETEVDANGGWQLSLELPVTDGAVTTVDVAYADGKGTPFGWSYQADCYALPPDVSGMSIFSNTASVTVKTETYGAARVNDGEWLWDTEGKGWVALDIAEAARSESLTITLMDAYGNVSETVSVPVQAVRDRVYGVISRPEDGAQFASDSVISVLADAVCGSAANMNNVRVELVDAQNAVMDTIYSDGRMSADQLAKTADNEELAGAQMDMGWRVSKREFDKSGLTRGQTYAFRLMAEVGGTDVELDRVTFSYAMDEPENALSVSSELEGWACGIDERDNYFNPASIWFTGYYYADEMVSALERAELTIYADKEMTESVSSKTITMQAGRNLYARNKEKDVIDSLADFSISTDGSGFVLLFQFERKEQLSEGTWWAEISFAGNERCTFGPIQIQISPDEQRITKIKQLTDVYLTDWVN